MLYIWHYMALYMVYYGTIYMVYCGIYYIYGIYRHDMRYIGPSLPVTSN